MKHNFSTHLKSKKPEKVRVINACIASSTLNPSVSEHAKTKATIVEQESEEKGESDDDESEEDEESQDEDYTTDDDIVLCEVGNSSADESTSDEDIGPMPRTRAGRTVTTYMTRRYFGDSD